MVYPSKTSSRKFKDVMKDFVENWKNRCQRLGKLIDSTRTVLQLLKNFDNYFEDVHNGICQVDEKELTEMIEGRWSHQQRVEESIRIVMKYFIILHRDWAMVEDLYSRGILDDQEENNDANGNQEDHV